MVGIDSSSFVRFLDGVRDRDTELVAFALRDGKVAVAGVVVTEMLSQLNLRAGGRSIVLSVPILPTKEGYWIRAASLRRDVREMGPSPKIPDVLIAQACLDFHLPLITYDSGFRRFEPAGLILA